MKSVALAVALLLGPWIRASAGDTTSSLPVYISSAGAAVGVTNSGLNSYSVGGSLILSTEPIVSSTSGVVGSVSLGNSVNKTIVSVSSTVSTIAIGDSPILSSYTVPSGLTFYLQSIHAHGYLTKPANTNVNFGSLVFFQQTVSFSSSSFYNSTGGGSFQEEQFDFSEPVPILSGQTIYAECFSASASAVTWFTTIIGYTK